MGKLLGVASALCIGGVSGLMAQEMPGECYGHTEESTAARTGETTVETVATGLPVFAKYLLQKDGKLEFHLYAKCWSLNEPCDDQGRRVASYVCKVKGYKFATRWCVGPADAKAETTWLLGDKQLCDPSGADGKKSYCAPILEIICR